MKNNDLVGMFVLSRAGRDKDHCYIVTEVINDGYVLLSNGSNKTITTPKKKKLRHLVLLDKIESELAKSILSKEKGVDLKIKRYIKLKGIVKEG